MTNTRTLKSRNQREGWYQGYSYNHSRTKAKWASLKGDHKDFFKNWMESIGLGGLYE